MTDDDIAYILFLEPTSRPPPDETAAESVLNFLITTCQPSPALMHTEILILPNDSNEHRCNFATYIDAHKGAAWQSANDDTRSYYLLAHAGRWRAVAVRGKNLASKLRSACNEEVGTSYSMVRYVTSTRLFRPFSSFLPSRVHSPAHCAVLTARCLRRAGYKLSHSPNYYSPTTLFLELDHTSTSSTSFSTPLLADHQAANALTRGAISKDAVSYLGADRCHGGIRALAHSAQKGDAQQRRVQQRSLATALLRSVLLR
jgi:hypothetical protein